MEQCSIGMNIELTELLLVVIGQSVSDVSFDATRTNATILLLTIERSTSYFGWSIYGWSFNDK